MPRRRGQKYAHPPGCGHCRMIEEFRLAREAQDRRVEEATLGYGTEKEVYYREVEPPLTLPRWLKQLAQSRDPAEEYPDVDPARLPDWSAA